MRLYITFNLSTRLLHFLPLCNGKALQKLQAVIHNVKCWCQAAQCSYTLLCVLHNGDKSSHRMNGCLIWVNYECVHDLSVQFFVVAHSALFVNRWTGRQTAITQSFLETLLTFFSHKLIKSFNYAICWSS